MSTNRMSFAMGCLLVFISGVASSQVDFSRLSAKDKELYNEHVIEGQPDGSEPILVRHGYVSHYNTKYRIPDWVAYHIQFEYLDTPERKGRFKIFRKDSDVPNPVSDADYTGGTYARGHMAPYFAMGGHRTKTRVSKFDPDNKYDQETIFQANYLTNISPQSQLGLNGPGGAWYALETAIRNNLVGKRKMDLHIVVGAIVSDPNNYETVTSAKTGETGIAIPDQFFQIIIYKEKQSNKYVTAAFLFPHVKKKPEKPLLDFLVTVDEIEKKTGLDILNQLPKAEQAKIEGSTNLDFWQSRFN